MSELQAYGFAFITPLIVRSLIPPKRFYPILLVTDNAKQIKDQVESAKSQFGGFRKPVVLAGSLEVLQTFLKQFPSLKDVRILLFDFPGLLIPFHGAALKWLDCDHQAGGSWQIARFSPETFETLMENLSPLEQSGRDFFTTMKRFVPNDQRLNEIEKFTENLPKTYKELLSNLTAENGNAEKKAKDDKKKLGGALRSILVTLVEKVPPAFRSQLVDIVLDYQLSLITKRDFLNKITNEVGLVFKDEALAIRKWIDSKSGVALYESYLDFTLNRHVSWASVLDAHKRVMEEDLLMLLAKQPRTVETIAKYSGITPAGEIPVPDGMPTVEPLDKMFWFSK